VTVVARLCDGRHGCGAVLVAARISPFPLKALQSVLIVQPAEVSIVGNGIGDAEIVLMVVEHDVGSFRKGIAVLLTVLTGCFRKVEDAYGTINWESIVLIAAMKPMSTALEKTDVSAMMSSSLASTLGEMGPYALIAGIYFTTSFITMFISNTATAVLMAPVVLVAAQQIHASPYSFLMAVALGASMCFASPFSTPSNALVMKAGHYKFIDYVRVGLPLQIIIGVAMTFLLPVFWPF
jgi:di/tricarboxylate transporter